MAGKSITVADDAVDAALLALYEAAGDVRPALKNIGEEEAATSRGRFITETDPQGQPWPDLNKLYAKTKKGPGKLRGETRALSQIVWQLAEDGNSVDIGSNEIYARIHNEGGEIRPKNAQALVFSMGGQTFMLQKVTIPQRQFLGFNPASIDAILGIVQDHFMYAVEAGNGSP